MSEAAAQPPIERGAWPGVAWALRRDLRLALRSKAELGVQLLFYIVVVTLFPLGVGADPPLLRALGPGVLWVAALLASLLSLPRLFAADFADGTLEQIHYALYVRCREQMERNVSPTACIIDSQSVKSAEKGGRALIRTDLTQANLSKARSGTC